VLRCEMYRKPVFTYDFFILLFYRHIIREEGNDLAEDRDRW